MEHHPAPLQLVPTKVDVDDDLTALLMSARPRDRMWTAEGTWNGKGRHGEGTGEALHPVDSAETVKAGVDVDVSLELLEAAAEHLVDAEGDQGVEGMQDVDPPRRRRR